MDYWEWYRERLLLERAIQEWAELLEVLNPWIKEND